jgi:hypothetical protein
MKPRFVPDQNPCPRSPVPIEAWLLGMLLLLGCGASYTVNLSAADIEESLSRKLPVSRSKLMVTLTVRAVSVDFMLGEDRVLLRPQVDLSVAGQPALSGRALVEGQIRYAPGTGEFFFDKPRVADVSIQGLPESARPVAEELVAKLGETYLAAMPLYRLNQKDFKQSLAKLVLKSVKVHSGRLQVSLGS